MRLIDADALIDDLIEMSKDTQEYRGNWCEVMWDADMVYQLINGAPTVEEDSDGVD